MNVRMQQQVLPPSVESANHADLGSQVFGIGRDLQQSLRAGSEQQVVEQTRVVQGQHIEFMGQREHHMEVAGGQEFSLAGRQPTLARLGLTLGTVPIPARVVRDGLMSTAQAGIPVATQCCGAAALNGTKRFELLEVKAGSIPVQEAIALSAEDVGHLQGGPVIKLVLALEGVADVLDTGQREAVQGIGDRLQVSLRQMQILSGSLQVAMTEQNLDGAQVGAGF